MIKFNPAQQRLFAIGAQERFVAALALRVAEYWPVEVELLGGERAAEAVRVSVDMANQLGFVTELDVARFTHLAFGMRSTQFHMQPWAQEVLFDCAELQPRLCMNRLFDAGCSQLAAAEAAQS